MPRHAGPLVLVACLAALPAAAADGGGSFFPYPTHAMTLDNGLRVLLVPMSSEGLVAYWTIVRTGARDEYEPGRTGFAHFFEHMMFRGTERFPAAVYNQLVTELGADANAFTSDDLTGYHLSIAAADLERVMELESDRFENLSYGQSQFQTEAGAVYGEYRKNRMSPFFATAEGLHREAFERHTYGHTAMGYEKDIQAMPRMYDYSKSFFGRYYRPENTVLLIVGDVDPEPTMELVKKYYGGWQPGYVAPEVPAEPEQTEERRIQIPYPGRSLPLLWVAYKTDAFSPQSRTYVAGLLLADLAFGETSDIHKKLVLDEQVVEFLNANLGMNRDPGLFDIITRVKDPQKVDYVLGEIDRVVAAARETPPDPRRLTDLKSRLRYSFLMDLDTPSNVAGSLARILAITGGIEAVDQLYRTLEEVTPEDVVAAADSYLVRQHRTIAVLKGES